MISILLPVYNGSKTLAQTLESIAQQDFTKFEIILVDDGSTDDSASIYENFNDSRLRFFKKENSGLASTLNFGISKTSFEFISRIDQDDLMEKEFLKLHLNAFKENPETVCVTNWATKIDMNNKTCGTIKPSQDGSLQRFEILFMNKYVHSAMSFKKSVIIELGGYPTDLVVQPPEDYYLWSKIFEFYREPIYVIPQFLTKYRITPNSMTQADSSIPQKAANISYLNIVNRLKTEDFQNNEWAKYASSRLHKHNTKIKISFFPRTIWLCLTLFYLSEVKVSTRSLFKLFIIIARILIPSNLKILISQFYGGKA
jgi:glycosyltransferase involved in cell wall biosynthesis